MRRWYKTLPAILLVVSSLGGCKSGEAPVDAWYVMEMRDSHWSLVHTDHTRHQQIRYIVTCNWSQWGDHEQVAGPGACNLPVGKVLVWNGLPDKPSDFVDVDSNTADFLFITEGAGNDRVMQGFTVRSARVEDLDPKLPPAPRPHTLADTWKK